MQPMTRYLHTMYRITDPDRSRGFYEALGLEFRRDMDIVRGGETEATNYFFGVPGQDEELELTFNHDGRTYELGTRRVRKRDQAACWYSWISPPSRSWRWMATGVLSLPLRLVMAPSGGTSLSARWGLCSL
jgi:catechol 2,3-dioxygenase-like lactoylglutathione lyase family enzyme